MSNGINTRQNEERSIQMLAAQREINNEIKIINCVIFGLSVVSPFILSFINLFIKNNIVETVVYLFSIALWAMSYWINNKIKSKKNIAAIIQQRFDSYVYGFVFNNDIDNIDINASIIEKSEKHFTKDINNRNELLNWYSSIIERLEEIKTKISEKRSKFKTGIVNVQNLIYDHRINCTSIPNFLYSKYKNIDEDNTEKTIIYENNK